MDPALLALAELHHHDFDKEVAMAFIDPDAAGKLAGVLQIEPARLNNDIATRAGQPAQTLVGTAAEDAHKAFKKLVARKITASKVERLLACDLLGLAARWGAGLLDADLKLTARAVAAMTHLHKLVLNEAALARAIGLCQMTAAAISPDPRVPLWDMIRTLIKRDLAAGDLVAKGRLGRFGEEVTIEPWLWRGPSHFDTRDGSAIFYWVDIRESRKNGGIFTLLCIRSFAVRNEGRVR